MATPEGPSSAIDASSVLEMLKLAETRVWARYESSARLACFVGILCAPFSLAALFWTSPEDYPFLSSMLWVPAVICGCILLVNSLWREDRFARLLFGAGIAVRLAAAGAFVWIGFYVYHTVVDSFHYWTVGYERAAEFSALGWAAFPPPYSSTNLIPNVCGVIMLVTGNALPTLCVIFAFAALWGGYFFYRAFCLAFPQGNRGLYGLLVVLLPSILYWSSAPGKDALAQLFIGISAYGFAKVVKQVDLSAILTSIVGIAGIGVVRPHVGGLLATSMLVPFAFGKIKGGWMSTSAKILLLPLLAAATVYMVSEAGSFVRMESLDFESAQHNVDLISKVNQLGGSSIEAGESLPRRVAEAPFLIFRPFPWEANNLMAALSSIEGIALFVLAYRARWDLWNLARRWREAYVGFLLLFSLQFCVIFSAASGNLGSLARERVMLLPLVLMLFCARLPAREMVAEPLARRDSWFRTQLPLPRLGR
jgi:hypothetical protein